MASQNPHIPHSRPNLLPSLLSFLLNGYYDHLPHHHHHHHHISTKKEEESFTLLQDVSSAKRGRRRRPSWFSHKNRRNRVSLSLSVLLLVYVLLSQRQVQIGAQPVKGPRFYSSRLLSTLAMIPYRNVIGEEGMGEGGEGSSSNLTKSGPLTEGTEVGEVLSPGRDLRQIQEMRKDGGGNGNLPALVESAHVSPPAVNRDGGKDEKGDEISSLYDLIEDSDIIANGMDDNLTTLELLFGDSFDEFNDNSAESMGSSSSPMFSSSPSSSDSSMKQIALPSDFDMSTGSSDLSSSPTGPPPELSPQNMENNDRFGGLQFSPPHLQQEAFDELRNLNALGLGSSSPLDFMMVEPSDVLPEVIASRQQLTEVEKSAVTVTKAEGKPIKVAARIADRRKASSTPEIGTGTLPSTANSPDVVVVVRQPAESVKTVTKKTRGGRTNQAGSTRSNNHQRSNLQIHGSPEESSSSPSPSGSTATATQNPGPVSETLPLNPFESFLGHNGMYTNNNGVLENENLKLPPFHEVNKRRLPRSVFKEYQNNAGSATFIVEEDETLVSGVSGNLDPIPVKRTKRRRVEMEKEEQGVLGRQQQQTLIADKQEKTNSPVISQPTFPETLLQQYLENGVSARDQVPHHPMMALSTAAATAINSPVPPTGFADHALSEVSSPVKELQLMPSLASQIQSQIQDNLQVFKVPSPITVGRQKARLAAVNSARLIKRQAPMLRLQHPMQQQTPSQEMSQQRQWLHQTTTSTMVHTKEHAVYSNPNELSPTYAPPNVNMLNQYAPLVDLGQKSRPQWQSQYAQSYSAGSPLQPYNHFPNLPSYNQFQPQALQQQQKPPYYQDALQSQLQRQPSAQNLPVVPMSPSSAFQYPESGTQQQTPPNRQYFPQTQLQQQLSAQNAPPYSSPLPPASPLPALPSSETGTLQQQGPIYGQQQGQSLVQTPMPASPPVHYLPQGQLQQQRLLQRAPQYSSPGIRTNMPSQSPVPGIVSSLNGPQRFGGYGVSNQIKNAQSLTSMSQYQQGQTYWNQEKASVGYGSANPLTPQTRYNIALQLQRLNAQKQARLILQQRQQEIKQSQLNSRLQDGTTSNQAVLQQYHPSRTSTASAPENHYGQQYFDPGLNQQKGQISNIPFRIQQNFNPQYSQAGRSPTPYPNPSSTYSAVQGQSGQITTGPYQGQMQSQNAYGTNGLIPDMRTPTAFNQYPYSSEVISGGEAALYRSRMGMQQLYPTVTRAGSSIGSSDTWRKSSGNEKEISVPIFQNDGKYIGQGNVNSSNGHGEEATPGNSYGGNGPSAPAMQLQQQHGQAPVHDAVTGRPTANVHTSETGSTGHLHQPIKHLPRPSGHTPFYSQAEVDAHHSRVTGNNQTSQDSEFENDSKILSWYMKKAKEEIQEFHHGLASVTQRPSSVPPADIHGNGHTTRPASAAGNYVTEHRDQKASASAKKTVRSKKK